MSRFFRCDPSCLALFKLFRLCLVFWFFGTSCSGSLNCSSGSLKPSIVAKSNRVLVIVNGQLRGGIIAWQSLKQFVLDFYNADLALIGPPPVSTNPNVSFLYSLATYVWEVPEYEDWGEVLDDLAHGDKSWRALCRYEEIKNIPNRKAPLQYLGGVKNCHPGSAGILLAYRYLSLKRIKDDGLAQLYGWFIYTRADYTYLCSPPSLDHFTTRFVYVPRGEGYGGITDRHSYIPSNMVDIVLNVTADVVLNWQSWLNHPGRLGLEVVLLTYFERYNICFRLYGHSAFTVRAIHDPTRWTEGSSNEHLERYGLKVKYGEEMKEAEANCYSWNKFHQDHGNLLNNPYKDGSLIRSVQSKTVYLLQNNSLHEFLTLASFTKTGRDFSEVIVVEPAELLTLDIGSPME